MPIVHYYRETEPSHSLLPTIKEQLRNLGLAEDAAKISSIRTESCFNVQLDDELSETNKERLEWLLAETFDKSGLRLEQSAFDCSASSPCGGNDGSTSTFAVEFGPRMTFTSAFSSNAVSICAACGLPQVSRLERSLRYQFTTTSGTTHLSPEAIKVIKALLHDRMTEEEYATPITTFESGAVTREVVTVPIIEEGRAALEKINDSMGLGFDDFDLDYYTNLFKVRLHVVCFELKLCWDGTDMSCRV